MFLHNVDSTLTAALDTGHNTAHETIAVCGKCYNPPERNYILNNLCYNCQLACNWNMEAWATYISHSQAILQNCQKHKRLSIKTVARNIRSNSICCIQQCTHTQCRQQKSSESPPLQPYLCLGIPH